MKWMRKTAATLLVLTLLCAVLPAKAAGPNGTLALERYHESTASRSPITADVVNLTLDGKPMSFTGDVPALVQEVNGSGRTLVPVRAVAEALGATVLWVAENRQVILRRGTDTVVLTLDSDKAVVNGVETPLPDGVPACSLGFPGQNSRTMVPLRFVSEQMGATVTWVQEHYTAQILRAKNTATQIIRVAANYDAQTVLIGTDHPPVFQVTDLGGKIVVDVQGAELASGFPGTITVDNELITTVRYAQHGADLYPEFQKTVRVVLDLKKGLTLEKNVRVEQQDDGILLTTFLTDGDREDVPPPLVPPLDPNKKTIVIDPGHGGSAWGAKYEGIMEKDLTLSISKKLESKLLKMGYNVIMTRSTDVYMDLYERSDLANAAKADLFVSVHCNASATNRDFEGIFTYYHPSSARGRRMAETIQPYLAKATGGIDRGVLKDDFVVLRETDMCAVLVETGFMTHHEELMRLADAHYQDKLAQGMADGITAYLRRL